MKNALVADRVVVRLPHSDPYDAAAKGVLDAELVLVRVKGLRLALLELV